MRSLCIKLFDLKTCNPAPATKRQNVLCENFVPHNVSINGCPAKVLRKRWLYRQICELHVETWLGTYEGIPWHGFKEMAKRWYRAPSCLMKCCAVDSFTLFVRRMYAERSPPAQYSRNKNIRSRFCSLSSVLDLMKLDKDIWYETFPLPLTPNEYHGGKRLYILITGWAFPFAKSRHTASGRCDALLAHQNITKLYIALM